MADDVTRDVVDKGAELLFWNQPIPHNILGGHLASDVARELGEAIRWENDVDGLAIYRGLAEAEAAGKDEPGPENSRDNAVVGAPRVSLAAKEAE